MNLIVKCYRVIFNARYNLHVFIIFNLCAYCVLLYSHNALARAVCFCIENDGYWQDIHYTQ